nr:Rv3235 family protein [Streptomyces cavernae]
MNKVMTRTNPRPRPTAGAPGAGTRPPNRRDPRRPGPSRRTPARSSAPALPSAPAPAAGPAASPAPPSSATADAAPVGGAGAAPATAPPVPARPTDVFAERLLAVLSGQRPVHCMLRHTVGRAYDELAWLAERSPLRTHGARPVVHDIGYYVPRKGALEVFARIAAGDRLRAMAFRLERGQDLRWRCTAVELGGERMPRPKDD